MKTTAKTVIALFFLCAMILPIATGWAGFRWEDFTGNVETDYNRESITEEVNSRLLSLSEEKTAQWIEAQLQAEGIFPRKVRVKMNISDESVINIEQAAVIFAENPSDNIKTQMELLFKQWNIPVVVIISAV